MTLSNSARHYGAVARSLHWLTALLILASIGLGLYAENLPLGGAEALAAKVQAFSLHKTLGMAAFAAALLRILWALTQTRPAPIHPERRLETFAADLVHWALYAAMILMPLSGWVHHAALDGFAPILWPFGQGLPFVPKSESLAEAAGMLHGLMSKLLIASVLLHVAGALKHAVLDRDGTLGRMLTGRPAGPQGGASAGHAIAPALLALGLIAAVFAAVLLRPAAPQAEAPAEAPAAAPTEAATETAAPATGGNWQVTTGTLAFTVKQMGADVQGTLPDWRADITFDETPSNGTHGRVKVEIDTTTLTLGSVTDQARGPEFFDSANHKTALFEAEILPAPTGYEAKGTLTLRGQTQPVSLPFTLTLAGDTATMQGAVRLDRRAFGMGASYGDESSVGFGVDVAISLTATRP